ncbi:MAG: 5-formyltetrahydrofolate cyclo-ligase [Frankia sp.]
MERDTAGPGRAEPHHPRPDDPAPDDPARDQKARLRRKLIAARRARADSPGDPVDADAARTARVLALPELERITRAAQAPSPAGPAPCVALYVALRGEPATRDLEEALRTAGVRILLPAVLPGRDLEFRVHGGELARGRFGTWEPPAGAPVVDLAAAGVIVVPALAVDRAGGRLGRGGGSYDRALARAGPAAVVVALLDDAELVPTIPTEPHDRFVDVVVTQHRSVRFRRADGDRSAR